MAIRYGAIKPVKPIEIPGKASALGVWVKGNASWGRVIYQLHDAKGEIWTSVGTKNDWNCDDAHCWSYVKFEGWRYVRFPLPGNHTWDQARDLETTWWGSRGGDGIVDLPLTLDKIIVAFTKWDEPYGENFSPDLSRWDREFLPALVRRLPAFARLSNPEGWAGLYEVSPDESAILGRVAAGDAGRHGGVYECHSFSGHGAMHSYAAGLGLAELISGGHYETVDFAPLSGERFARGAEIRESLVI